MAKIANILLSIAVLLFTNTAQAIIRLVPEEYEYIQWAINDANDGDIISIATGTYSEYISFKGLDIVVGGRGYVEPGGN